MPPEFSPDGRLLLIGSQPLNNHDEAVDLVLSYASQIPNWVQLPSLPNEGMVTQFADGLPGLLRDSDKLVVDTTTEGFDDDLLAFFEEYLKVTQTPDQWEHSRFVLTPETTRGFFTMVSALSALKASETLPADLYAVKGQTTGPFTFATAIKDQDGRPIFYHDTLRDAAVKLLALKAGWQARRLGELGVPVILFIDEPALSGYGTSEFISVSREHVTNCLEEVITAIHCQNALAGVHVCANTDWSLLLDSPVDIINFDAFGYFDKFILYGDAIKTFLDSGRTLAWGLVPTADADAVRATGLDALWELWQYQSGRIASLGIDLQTLRKQSLITPSCGTGPLPKELGRKVLDLTRDLSQKIRAS